ncbi:hypothetical protein [Citrobacter meridianamericanus]|uniref:hypothetical protein n=1 Tax=Citrobacter meridianamericanus TaxID=2894201 RepID=UPI00351D4926
MRITKVQGFDRITPFMVTAGHVDALKRCGLDMVDSVTGSNYSAGVDTMAVLGNTFSGIGVSSSVAMPVLKLMLNRTTTELTEKALQVGFRLTQPGMEGATSTTMLSLTAGSSLLGFVSDIKNTPDKSSVYYELVFGRKAGSLWFSIWSNGRLVQQNTWNMPAGDQALYLSVGNNGIRPVSGKTAGFMVGDVYMADLDYNADGSIPDERLGSLTVESYEVSAYHGEGHANSEGNDVLTALNNPDYGTDTGVLSLKPVKTPASLTFAVPQTAGRNILGVGISLVYRDSLTPNNRIRYAVTAGETSLPAETITRRSNDITGFTTFTHLLTRPPGGGEWAADMPLKVDLYNDDRM